MNLPRSLNGTTVMVIAVAMALTGCASSPHRPLRNPDAQWAPTMSQCLRDKGWDVTVADGKLDATYPTSQEASYQHDIRVCHDELGYRMVAIPSREDAGQAYDTLLDVSRCLGEHGYAVSQPPSRDSYMDALTKGRIVWHPYSAALQSANPPMLSDLERACPVPDQP
jgi:hypothetical protein